MNLEDLEICLFSFNLGDYANSNFTNYNLIKSDFEKLFKPNNNRIWAVTTQEDKTNSIFMQNLENYFLSIGYTRLVYFGTSDMQKKGFSVKESIYKFGSSMFNKIVKLAIFIPITLTQMISVMNETPVLVKHSTKFNKSSLVVSLIITIPNYKPILLSFIGSHLPINTKEDIKLGVDLRIAAMNECLSEFLKIQSAFLGKNSQSTSHLLWTGDLNFRLEDYGNINSDQLRNVINGNNLQLKLQDFTPIDKIGATCKTISNTKLHINNNNNSNTKPLLQDNNLENRNIKTKQSCADVYMGLSNEDINKCYDVFVKKKIIKKRLATKKHNNKTKKSFFKKFLSLSKKTNKNKSKKYLLLENNNSESNTNTINTKNNKNNKKISCKTIINTRSPIKEDDKYCFEILKSSSSNNDKHSTMRFPSYCDRILGYSNDKSILLEPFYVEELNLDQARTNNPLAVRPLVSLGFISVSDHNPIFGTFKFNTSFSADLGASIF